MLKKLAPKKFLYRKVFFVFAVCILCGICALTVSADAPEDVIINVQNNYPDYFEQNGIISDALRYLSWLLIQIIRAITDFCVTLYEHSLGFMTLISENINTYVPHAQELFTAILAVSLLAMGIIFIIHPQKKPDILLSLFLMVVSLALQTVILNPMIAPTQSAVSELAMSNSVANSIVNSHIHDLLYIDQYLPNGLSDLADGSIDIDDLTLNLTDSQIDNLDVNEVINYENSRLSDGAKGKDGILGKRLEIYYNDDGTEEPSLTDVYNGFGWNSEDSEDFFNEFYYRYKIDSFEIILALIAILIVYLMMAYKVIRIVIEIIVGNILTIFYSANFNSSQKVIQILKEILNCFIVLMLSAVLIRVFTAAETLLNNMDLSGIEYGFLLIFIALAIVDGPNMIQRIVGIDAGISSEMAKIFAISQMGNMVGAGVRTAGAALGVAAHGAKGVAHLGKSVWDKFSGDGSSNQPEVPPDHSDPNGNGIGENEQSPQDENSGIDNAQKATPSQAAPETDSANIPEENADIPPDMQSSSSEDAMPPDMQSSNFEDESSEIQTATDADAGSSSLSGTEGNKKTRIPPDNGTVHAPANDGNFSTATSIGRGSAGINLNNGGETNYELYNRMDTDYESSMAANRKEVDGVSGIGATNSTSMEFSGWRDLFNE